MEVPFSKSYPLIFTEIKPYVATKMTLLALNHSPEFFFANGIKDIHYMYTPMVLFKFIIHK